MHSTNSFAVRRRLHETDYHQRSFGVRARVRRSTSSRDEGFYCIDNLPASLLPALVKKTSGEEFELFSGTAVCIDARNAWKDLRDFGAILESLPSSVQTQVLFLNAQEGHPVCSALARPVADTR